MCSVWTPSLPRERNGVPRDRQSRFLENGPNDLLPRRLQGGAGHADAHRCCLVVHGVGREQLRGKQEVERGLLAPALEVPSPAAPSSRLRAASDSALP